MAESSDNLDSCEPQKKPLGEILVAAGLVEISQIALALREQKQNGLRIGEILVSHGWIDRQTRDFFVGKWLEVLQEQNKKPPAYYLKKAGLLNDEQIDNLVLLQQMKENKVQLHRLAVEEGYLKQITADFFLAYLFKIYNPHILSSIKPYTLLKEYIKGTRNFQRIDISQALLKNVSLRSIILDGSNLRKADLSNSNLSNSSMIGVNLNLANCTQTVLTNVNFTRSFLTKANLQAAYLDKANFQSAILREVNLQEAYLAGANFSGADLRGAKLPLNYSYEVYYSKRTIFDSNFSPKSMGWKKE